MNFSIYKLSFKNEKEYKKCTRENKSLYSNMELSPLQNVKAIFSLKKVIQKLDACCRSITSLSYKKEHFNYLWNVNELLSHIRAFGKNDSYPVPEGNIQLQISL